MQGAMESGICWANCCKHRDAPGPLTPARPVGGSEGGEILCRLTRGPAVFNVICRWRAASCPMKAISPCPGLLDAERTDGGFTSIGMPFPG